MIGPVLLIGPAEREEFRAIAELLTASGPWIAVPDPAAATAMLSPVLPIELVVIVPAHRDAFPNDALQQLVRQQPLAEYWLVVGPWLEGETRSGRPWPGGRRWYLDQALAELRRRIDLAASGGPARGWLPPTLSPEERALADRSAWSPARGRARICCELPETRRTLMSLCTAMGLTTVAHRPEQIVDVGQVDAAIYDAVASRRRWRAHLERLTVPRPRSLVVLANFPRPDEVRDLLAAGATDVLGKPFRVDDLRTSILRGWSQTGVLEP